MSPEKQNNTKLKVTSALVVIIAVAMLTIASTATKAQQSTRSGIVASPMTSTTASAVTATPPAQTSTSSASSNSGYRDGAYSATSDYYVPHGYEEIQVSLTIKNGVVTDSSVQNSEGNRESAQYQRAFASSYKTYVTGKNISDLNLSYVAGASDTTQGFNDAVSQIQTQAKA